MHRPYSNAVCCFHATLWYRVSVTDCIVQQTKRPFLVDLRIDSAQREFFKITCDLTSSHYNVPTQVNKQTNKWTAKEANEFGFLLNCLPSIAWMVVFKTLPPSTGDTIVFQGLPFNFKAFKFKVALKRIILTSQKFEWKLTEISILEDLLPVCNKLFLNFFQC